MNAINKPTEGLPENNDNDYYELLVFQILSDDFFEKFYSQLDDDKSFDDLVSKMKEHLSGMLSLNDTIREALKNGKEYIRFTEHFININENFFSLSKEKLIENIYDAELLKRVKGKLAEKIRHKSEKIRIQSDAVNMRVRDLL